MAGLKPSWIFIASIWIQLGSFPHFWGWKTNKHLWNPSFYPNLTKHGVVFKDPKVFFLLQLSWFFNKDPVNSTNFPPAEVCVQWPLKRRKTKVKYLGMAAKHHHGNLLSRVTPLQCCLKRDHFFKVKTRDIPTIIFVRGVFVFLMGGK